MKRSATAADRRLSPDDAREHIDLECLVERCDGPPDERLAYRLALDVLLFLRRNPGTTWDTARDAMNRVSELIICARNRNRACHWSPRRRS